jgi:hypothetical protein
MEKAQAGIVNRRRARGRKDLHQAELPDFSGDLFDRENDNLMALAERMFTPR